MQVMVALAQTGQEAAALEQYVAYSQMLAQEFALGVSPEITEHEVLDAGYDELMRLAEMIGDPEWKRSFLEDERSNRALIARFALLPHQLMVTAKAGS